MKGSDVVFAQRPLCKSPQNCAKFPFGVKRDAVVDAHESLSRTEQMASFAVAVVDDDIE